MSKQKKKRNQKNKRILLIASCLAVFVIGLILAILVLGGKDTEKKYAEDREDDGEDERQHGERQLQ